MKKVRSFFFFLCAINVFYSFPIFSDTPLGLIENRLDKQQIFPRVGGWCFVPWKNQKFSAVILNIQEEIAMVRIFDTEVPFSQWPLCFFPINQLKPHVCEKSATAEELIASLKTSHKLTTPMIEKAFCSIDRAWFCAQHPYFDAAIDIGYEMCISAPHMHVLSLELCRDLLANAKSILDVGSGSGYLTALFSQLAPHAEVIGIECFEGLVAKSQETVAKYMPSAMASRVKFIQGNGEKGFHEKAPYTIIYVGFMCKDIPQDLVDQLAPGGRMIVPIGNQRSTYDERCLRGELYVVEKMLDGAIKKHEIFTCSFVPSQEID